jgi:hypothetical protein
LQGWPDGTFLRPVHFEPDGEDRMPFIRQIRSFSMLTRFAQIVAISALALGTAVTAANAGCQGRRATGTAVGAVGGGVVGNAVSGGSAGGTIAGAVIGGLAGRAINSDGCHNSHSHYRHHRRGYYDRHHHWHSYGH